MKKINMDRPQISSAEIKERQNFEDLLSRYKELEKQPFYKKYWTYIILVGVFSAAGTYYLLQQSDSTSAIEKKESTSRKTEITTIIKEERIIDNKIAFADKTNSNTLDKSSLKADQSQNPANTSMVSPDTSSAVSGKTIASTGNAKELERKIQELNSEISVLKEKIKQLEASQPMKPQEAKGNYLFKIDVLAKEFPKLTKYKGLLFEVPADEKNFSPEFVKTEWSSGTIEEDIKGNYQLTLTKGKKSYTFRALPVFKGNSYNLALKEYNQYRETLDSLVKEEKKKEMERNEFIK